MDRGTLLQVKGALGVSNGPREFTRFTLRGNLPLPLYPPQPPAENIHQLANGFAQELILIKKLMSDFLRLTSSSHFTYRPTVLVMEKSGDVFQTL